MHHLSDDFEFNVHWKPFMLNPYMPEEGMPIMDYLRLKFGDEAAERFVSGSSPVSQQGKAAVRYLMYDIDSPELARPSIVIFFYYCILKKWAQGQYYL